MIPIFSSKKSAPLNAGQTSDGVQFTNAPWTQVNTASKPLFTGKNTVDGEVLYDLLAYINSTTVWNGVTENNTTPNSGSAYTALTCEDFGKLDTSTKNAQLLVTLFGDTIVNSDDKAVQWQVVYRSMGDTSDVLTLYMNDTYTTTSIFDSTGIDNNYLTSDTLRDFVSTGSSSLQSKVASAYGTNYLVAPKDVPSSWQSSTNQHDSNGNTSYSINNGLDNVEDLLWIPSGYEVLAAWTEKEAGDLTSVSSTSNPGATLRVYNIDNIDNIGYKDIDTTTTNGRTGLWELNGYDRASNSEAWVRSGYSDNDYYVYARGINARGEGSCNGVDLSSGVRVALHLSVDSLAKELCEVSASSTASSGTAPTYTLSTASRNLQTVTTYNYKNYLVPNNTTEKGSATVTFTERSATRINSFTLNGTSINVNSANGSGKVNGVCDYSYTYENGKLAVSVSNLSVSTKIVANAAKTQTLTIDANGGTFASGVSNTAQGAQNSTYSLPSASQLTKTGYTLSGYTLTSGGGSVSGFTYTFGSSSGTIKANWTAISYSITYNLDGGSISGQKTSYTIEASTFTLQTPTKAGYTFSGWTGSNGTTPQTSVTITKGSTGDKTYTANWTAISYSITYNLDGGSISGQKTSYTIETSTFTLQTPTKAGYTFSGWTGSNGTTPQTSVSITKGSTGNKTYTANWTLDIANVTLSITLNNSGRQYMIYILDSTGQPKHQFVVQKSGTIKFTISKNEKFSVLVFETLYMTTTIDGETTRKKVYNSGVSADKTIPITISSASNQVNNWLIV